ncbi:phosphonate C-P lyase system protein PhnH [Leptothoe spongobia]|uniref:Phosphonate C-P lyase system protein PhnH n=1 Tax=Leptothoe spongobia TAU-MAC 1115 TaxID=1967444 RepID=A0A947DF01_9CYAN|nr:phosphonate C-P lyase system protein PhnH [Leptothoe spongobia]MBT9314691.1 phosphonate C-P lyase system protein PhnH [Leptothoe spongobia TAU-MAC 1115]
MITQLAGFADAIHDAQHTFRALLDALARPGIPQTTVSLTPPSGLESSCAATCLTLLDLETSVWLQPGLPADVRSWLVFHTGCRFTDHPHAADFALIWQLNNAPELSEFSWGTAEYPESSTSLLIQLPNLTGGEPITLEGPGILSEIEVSLPMESAFWQQWETMTANYPLGLDCWCFAQNQIMGLPRTSKLTASVYESLGFTKHGYSY